MSRVQPRAVRAIPARENDSVPHIRNKVTDHAKQKTDADPEKVEKIGRGRGKDSREEWCEQLEKENGTEHGGHERAAES